MLRRKNHEQLNAITTVYVIHLFEFGTIINLNSNQQEKQQLTHHKHVLSLLDEAGATATQMQTLLQKVKLYYNTLQLSDVNISIGRVPVVKSWQMRFGWKLM